MLYTQSYAQLTDEQLIEEAIQFVKYGQQLPAEFIERLDALGLLNVFTTDTKAEDS